MRLTFLLTTGVLALGACGTTPGPDGDSPVDGSGGTAGGTGAGGNAVGGSSTGGSSTGGVSAGGTSSGGATAGGTSSGGATAGGTSSGGSADDGEVDVLVFSRTVEYRHASIEDGVAALQTLADQRGWALSATEDAAMFAADTLAAFDVVVFLSTTGDVLDAAQQTAFEDFIRSGKGYVGVHAASDTEYDWPWYGELVGAYFSAHPDIQQASVLVEDTEHPATVGLGSPWIRTDEWYGFDQNPRGAVSVLLTVDESSYDAGEGSLGDDHPIAWYHEYDGGRSFYTALGHTPESYIEPSFLDHLAGGIEWATGSP